jgi:hypothetical protein
MRDIQIRNNLGKYRKYPYYLLILFTPLQRNRPNPVYSIIKYRIILEILSDGPAKLKRYRFFNASIIIRAAYIISVELIESGIFLINNIIDWSEYTELYTLK